MTFFLLLLEASIIASCDNQWLFILAYYNETNKKTHIWERDVIKYVHIYHVEIKKNHVKKYRM